MHVVLTFAVAAAGMAAPATAAPAAGQTVMPSLPAVFSWGWNIEGEVGDGTTTDRASPVPVPGLTRITQVAVGGNALGTPGALRVPCREGLDHGSREFGAAPARRGGEGHLHATVVADVAVTEQVATWFRNSHPDSARPLGQGGPGDRAFGDLKAGEGAK